MCALLPPLAVRVAVDILYILEIQKNPDKFPKDSRSAKLGKHHKSLSLDNQPLNAGIELKDTKAKELPKPKSPDKKLIK